MNQADYLIFSRYLAPDLEAYTREFDEDGNRPLPYPYSGEVAVQRIVNALIHVVDAHGCPSDDALRYEHRNLVKEARSLLLCSCIAIMQLYFPEDDCNFDGLSTLVCMEEYKQREDLPSPLAMIFDEIKTGFTYVPDPRGTRSYVWVPSQMARWPDEERPADSVHRDGSHGFTADEDDAVMFYNRYRECCKKLRELDPNVDFIFQIKQPLGFLAPDPLSIFNKKEKRMLALDKRVDSLRAEYAKNVRRKSYDLLEKLMIEGIFAYVEDSSVPIATRESYVSKLTSLVQLGQEKPMTHASAIAGKDKLYPTF